MSSDKNLFKKAFALDPAELTPAQRRLLQSLGPLLAHLMSTDDEEEYFEASKELMSLSATIIQQSSFPELNGHIPYGEQAVEYALDQLNEVIMNNSDPIKWDN